MDVCFFTNSYVHLPFDEFTMGVLRVLNVAPTQLYPNSWDYVLLSPQFFLHYYSSRPVSHIRWLSLVS